MQVLKIVLEGVTTSFRYPHFMLGVQPSFPPPPPATIYGHVCSALGEWVAPEGWRSHTISPSPVRATTSNTFTCCLLRRASCREANARCWKGTSTRSSAIFCSSRGWCST